MTTLAELSKEADCLKKAETQLRDRVNAFLNGKKITVTNEHWNGQPIGRSWPKLIGKTFEIDHAIIWDGEISVWFDGSHNYCYMPIKYGVLR